MSKADSAISTTLTHPSPSPTANSTISNAKITQTSTDKTMTILAALTLPTVSPKHSPTRSTYTPSSISRI
jgi:hypothetical protein